MQQNEPSDVEQFNWQLLALNDLLCRGPCCRLFDEIAVDPVGKGLPYTVLSKFHEHLVPDDEGEDNDEEENKKEGAEEQQNAGLERANALSDDAECQQHRSGAD